MFSEIDLSSSLQVLFPYFHTRYESCVINCEKGVLCIIMFFDSSSPRGHKDQLVLSLFRSYKYKKNVSSELQWIQITGHDVMWLTVSLWSSTARQIIRGKKTIDFALPYLSKQTKKMRRFLPSSISFPACWQLYKSLWNNCVFLIKCEMVAISMPGSGTEALCTSEDVSPRLRCAGWGP